MEQAHEDKSRRTQKLLWGLVALLLIVNGVLFYQLLRSSEELETTQKDLVSTQDLREDLENELQSAQSSISAYENQVSNLDSTIARKNAELEERAGRIQTLLRSQRITREQYRQAKRELDQLRYYAKKYQFEIDSLYQVNKKLSNQNQALKSDVKKAKKQTEELKDENARLSNKVALGARLEAASIEVTGVRIRNNGKERETMWVGNMERLRICVELEENLVADKGPREILVRLIGPSGAVLYAEDRGGGQFNFRGEETFYSFKGTINFQNKQELFCHSWNPQDEMENGDWKAELYTNSYKIGETNFRLRQLF